MTKPDYLTEKPRVDETNMPIKHIDGDPFQCKTCKKRITEIVEKLCSNMERDIDYMIKDNILDQLSILHALKSMRKTIDMEIASHEVKLRNDDD